MKSSEWFLSVFCWINIKHTVGSRNIACGHFKSRTDPIYCYTHIFSIISLHSFNNRQGFTWITTKRRIDTFLRVFDRLGAYVQLKDDFTCLCAAPSLSAYTNIPWGTAQALSRFIKTLINLINFNNSSTSNFAKVTMHDFTDLHVKMGFYGGVKAHCWKGGRHSFLDHCIFIIVGGRNGNWISINCTALRTVSDYVTEGQLLGACITAGRRVFTVTRMPSSSSDAAT